MWTRDELAVSFGRKVPIVLLVEKGATLENGILGDWEYIPFETDHIGDTYIGILEAVNFIKNNKS